MTHTGNPESTTLSGAEYAVRASAFNDGVELATTFFKTRRAILARNTPQTLSASSEQLSRAFAHLAARVIRRYPRVLRHLLTTEFIAGVLNNLLDEEEWRDDRALTLSDLTKLKMMLRRRSRARWRRTPVRAPSGQEYELQALALEDGRKLAARFFEARKSIPEQQADHDQWYESVERFTQELVDTAIGAMATYPSRLRYWLSEEQLGGFIAALLTRDT